MIQQRRVTGLLYLVDVMRQIVTETVEIATSNNKEKIICLAFGEFQGI